MVELELKWLGHAGFRLAGEKIVYVDPFQLPKNYNDADIMICTHEHHDHCSIDDIKKVITPKTVIICPADCISKLKGLKIGNIVPIEAKQKLIVKGVPISAIPAYNVNKFRAEGIVFHPKDNAWVGIVIELGGKKVYHSGDTDKIPEMAELQDIDIALMAVGGKYTMDVQEAVEAVLMFHPKKAIPMHYGSIVGSVEDAIAFKNAVVKHGIASDVLNIFM
ncbi:Zn-dependent hydrolase [Candidatus Woesearchaeota archaeon CG10_big_fil_rev_8_21_14_0_10_34_8]|nr:MAG: Zn-dependent hydrolase [Candidatus Woesearchaeota archaeon CG10_big_fil_rev_8_21_14_0_10_34_8]